MLKELIQNPWYASIIIFIVQILFLYLRTLNVIYTAERKMLGAIITGNGIGITWLIAMAVGANAILEGEYIPIIAHLIGGTIGTYWGLKSEQKKEVFDPHMIIGSKIKNK